jgi:hypothetical protein
MELKREIKQKFKPQNPALYDPIIIERCLERLCSFFKKIITHELIASKDVHKFWKSTVFPLHIVLSKVN